MLEYFRLWTSEVHVVFDSPSTQIFNPKQFEQVRRHNSKTPQKHEHHLFNADSSIPQGRWSEFLDCPSCKRKIVEALGLYFLQSGRFLLHSEQHIIISGCFTPDNAWLIAAGTLPERAPSYNSNALEADNRVWRHATQTAAMRVIINSPDTDVYQIGLSVPDNKEYIVQFNVHHATDKKYIILKQLKRAFHVDPDLHALPREDLNLIMQCLYICSGCDYISYVKSFGKATILNNYFQYANFISGTNYVGNLSQTNPSDKDNGFLSFIRLIGSCYFIRHRNAFDATYGHSTPVQLYNSIDSSLPIQERHQCWLQKIRQTTNTRIVYEEERVPTYTALWRHWLRSCWVHQMWQRSTYSDMYMSLPPPEHSGWTKDGESYGIDWEATDVMNKVIF